MTTSSARRVGPALLLAGVLALAACYRAPTPAPAAPASTSVPATQPSAPAASAPRTADAWLGRWIGPEGTFVDLSARTGGAGYSVTIQSLDGPATYEGRAVEGGIAFERAGQTETLRATDGQATGMKWLLDKKNCLTVRTGEGFCRD